MGKTKELKPTKHVVSISFTPEQMAALREAAIRDHRNVKNYVELLVIQHIEKP